MAEKTALWVPVVRVAGLAPSCLGEVAMQPPSHKRPQISWRDMESRKHWRELSLSS